MTRQRDIYLNMVDELHERPPVLLEPFKEDRTHLQSFKYNECHKERTLGTRFNRNFRSEGVGLAEERHL